MEEKNARKARDVASKKEHSDQESIEERNIRHAKDAESTQQRRNQESIKGKNAQKARDVASKKNIETKKALKRGTSDKHSTSTQLISLLQQRWTGFFSFCRQRVIKVGHVHNVRFQVSYITVCLHDSISTLTMVSCALITVTAGNVFAIRSHYSVVLVLVPGVFHIQVD
jgi:hypothetical protein